MTRAPTKLVREEIIQWLFKTKLFAVPIAEQHSLSPLVNKNSTKLKALRTSLNAVPSAVNLIKTGVPISLVIALHRATKSPICPYPINWRIVFKGMGNIYLLTHTEKTGNEYHTKMNTNNISKSKKIFIRREKARIRRSILDLKEQEKLISDLNPTSH